jgi:hypothetical protein
MKPNNTSQHARSQRARDERLDRILRRLLTAALHGGSHGLLARVARLHRARSAKYVVKLERAKGTRISRREETVSGYVGAPTRVMRYWLDYVASIELARTSPYTRCTRGESV